MEPKIKYRIEGLKSKGTPNDEVYLKELRLSCPFCKNNGPSKVYSNLWKLSYHFRFHHGYDVYCEKLISNLESLIMSGVLR